MKKVEVVFIATPGIGNLVPAVEFAQRLIDRDQRLSATILVIDIPQRPIVGAYVDSRSAVSSTGGIQFLHLPPADSPSPDQYQSSIAGTCIFIQNHKPQVKDAISNLLSTDSNSVSPGALFVDMFCTSMIDVANELHIPSYLYFASPASFLGFMLHLPTLDTQLTTKLDGSESELIIPGFVNPVPPLVLPSFVLRRHEEDGYFWFLSHARRYKETKGIIVNTFREMEPHAIDSVCTGETETPPVYPVGPVLDLTGPIQWQPDRLRHETVITWLDRQPPSSVVFLCFGSMGSFSVSQVREIAHGLERTGYRFLWSIREPPRGKMDLPNDYTNIEEILPDGFLERTEGIGLVCGWVPQVTILAHHAIGGFISHCGWNSIMESLWYGVPIATWPIYAEQQMNAFQMVRELELAVEIRLDYRYGSNLVHAEEVERGVRRLMDGDNEVRRKTKEMGEISRMSVMENGSSYTSLGRLIEELTAMI